MWSVIHPRYFNILNFYLTIEDSLLNRLKKRSSESYFGFTLHLEIIRKFSPKPVVHFCNLTKFIETLFYDRMLFIVSYQKYISDSYSEYPYMSPLDVGFNRNPIICLTLEDIRNFTQFVILFVFVTFITCDLILR